MATTRRTAKRSLPHSFEALVGMMIPQAIQDDVQLENTIEMIDELMALRKLTPGQARFLETLLQLVEAYEAKHHAVETQDISGIDALKHLLEENKMNASDLARLLGVHPTMGSKILLGERFLTVAHIQRLTERFKVNPALFL